MKPATVQFGHRMFALGLATLAVTLTGAVLLVLDVAVGRWFAVPTAVTVGFVLIALWFCSPCPCSAAAEPSISMSADDPKRFGQPDNRPAGAQRNSPFELHRYVVGGSAREVTLTSTSHTL